MPGRGNLHGLKQRLMNECNHSTRFSHSDLSGPMRFDSFDVADIAECKAVAVSLREYLVRRPLAEVDVERIRSMERDGTCLCVREVARVVRERQGLFGGTDRPGRTQVT